MFLYYPPLNPMPNVPVGKHYGSFGVARKFAHHCGVDLYAQLGSSVFAVESGTVVDICQFTGEAVKSPWWEDTWQISIEGATGVLVYGEINMQLLPFMGNSIIRVGDSVTHGQLLGNVKRVLKKDKGKPTSMLHFMLLQHGFKDNDIPTWELGKPKPEGLLDPTAILIQCVTNYVLSATWR